MNVTCLGSRWERPQWWSTECQPALSPLKKNLLFIYLAVPGLGCGMRDLVPWLGIEPGLPALGAWSLATGPPGKAPVSPLFNHQSLGLIFLVPELRCFNWAFGFVPFQLKWENHFQSTGHASSILHQTYTKLLPCEVAIWLAALFYQSPRLTSWLKSFVHLQSSKLQITPVCEHCVLCLYVFGERWYNFVCKTSYFNKKYLMSLKHLVRMK